MPGERDKKAILQFLAESLSFAKTLEKFPELDLELLRQWIRGAYPDVDASESEAADTPQLSRDIFEAFVDGASRGNPGQAGAGILIKSADKKWEFSIPLGVTTNNVAEYEALIIALIEAKKLGAKEIHIKSDSELMVKQVTGEYKVKDEKLKPLHARVKKLSAKLKCTIKHLPREENKEADKLANIALDEVVS